MQGNPTFTNGVFLEVQRVAFKRDIREPSGLSRMANAS